MAGGSFFIAKHVFYLDDWISNLSIGGQWTRLCLE